MSIRTPENELAELNRAFTSALKGKSAEVLTCKGILKFEPLNTNTVRVSLSTIKQEAYEEEEEEEEKGSGLMYPRKEGCALHPQDMINNFGADLTDKQYQKHLKKFAEEQENDESQTDHE